MVLLMGVLAMAALVAWWLNRSFDPPAWSEAEIDILRSLWIGSLPPLDSDSSNAVGDDSRAAMLGKQLFFDRRLSGNGAIACATCHQPERRFTDGLAKGQAIGTSKRNTPSIVGVAYSPWLYWDGRKDSQWSQALSPLEDPDEHGGSRMQYVRLIAEDPVYKTAYEALFGSMPDLSDRNRFPERAGPVEDAKWHDSWQAMTADDQELVNKVFANLGKSIAAYERLLMPGPSRFDTYVEAVLAGDDEAQRATFNKDETRGLRLFIGEANCTQCHNGPLFTNHEFHNTGVISFPGEVPDKGRVAGVRTAKSDPFNCLGAYSDDPEKNCAELRFARSGAELIGAVRTPSLRNLDATAPFMHKGQMATIAEVLDHYNRAPLAMIGHNEAKPLKLSRRELRQLERFLETLAAPLATPPEWLEGPARSALLVRPLAARERRPRHMPHCCQGRP
ncbi:MAG: cytochrome-c peroxidase [Woeseiaceae bacterium]